MTNEREFTQEQGQILNAFLSGVLFHARLDDLVELDSEVAWARFGKTIFKTAEHYQARVNAADSEPDVAAGEGEP